MGDNEQNMMFSSEEMVIIKRAVKEYYEWVLSERSELSIKLSSLIKNQNSILCYDIPALREAIQAKHNLLQSIQVTWDKLGELYPEMDPLSSLNQELKAGEDKDV